MARPVVYYNPISCVCQSVLLAVKATGIDVELKMVDLSKGEHLSAEYIKLNPRHCVPFLVDGDFKLWESHAIIPYLLDKYAKDDSIYPRDLALRAQINAFLHFDNGILYTRVRNMSEPLFLRKSKTVSEENSKCAEDAYQLIEKLIGEGPWLLGDRLTIADICCLVNIKAIEVFIGDTSYYPKLTKWLKHCAENVKGYEEIVSEGAKAYRGAIRHMMSA